MSDGKRLAALANFAALTGNELFYLDNGLIDANITAAQLQAYIAISLALTGDPTAPTPDAGDNSNAVATTAYLDRLLAVANGIATLGIDGKVPVSQLPSAVVGSLNYKGSWNASTNTPAIPAAAAGNKGWYYVVTVAGTTAIDGTSSWGLRDWIVSDGTQWEKVDNNNAVVSVAGLIGAITASALKTALSIAAGDVSGLGSLATASSVTVSQISDASANGRSLIAAANYAAMRTLMGLGSAALLTAGTAANNAVQLDASAKLPAVDGSALTNLPGSTAATQAQMEAASATSVMVTPGRQQYHPSAAKAWVLFNGTGTVGIKAGYNVSSVTDNGVGDFTINFTVPFSSANYAANFSMWHPDGFLYGPRYDSGFTTTASAIRFKTARTDTSVATDLDAVCASFFGDQ